MKINSYEIAYSEDELKDMVENKMRQIELVDRNFEGYKRLADGDKKALEHLVAAAKMMNDVSLEQDHKLNRVMKRGLENEAGGSMQAAYALRLFNSLNGVEGVNGVDEKPVEIFKGISGSIGRNFYPDDLTVKEFHEIISRMLDEGKKSEVQGILSARTMVRRHGDGLHAIDYTEYFAPVFSEMANELEVAAHYATDEKFKDFLGWQAQALLQNNEDMDMLADKHWAVLQDNDLEFTIGRENYDDQMTQTVYDNPALLKKLREAGIEVNNKDMLGVRVGIVNHEGTRLIMRFKEHMSELAELMPYKDQYKQNVGKNSELKQTMVDVDLVALTGDYAQCRGAITTAQNLPNNDKPAVKTGGGRRNVYHRQVRQSADMDKYREILKRMVAPELHGYFDVEADHLFVIGHENAHSLGPAAEYQNALGQYKNIIEEHKADVASIAFMPEYVKNGTISEEQLRKIYTTWVVYRLFMKAKPVFAMPHRIADLMQFNYLLENGAISFDQDDKLHINFEVFGKVMNKFLEETIAVQLSKSPQKAKTFVDRLTNWGEYSVKIAALHEELGLKPYIEIKSYF